MDNSANNTKRTWAALLAAGALGLGACSRLDAPSQAPRTVAPPPVFAGSATTHMSIGLVSIAPETTRLRVDWRAENMGSFSGDFALFLSPTRANLYSTAPTILNFNLNTFVFSNLLDRTEYFVGIGLAENTGDALLPTGQVLSAKTGNLVYVDVNAPAAGANGMTPATAFPVIFPGVLTAFLGGGGNVLVAEGTYVNTSLSLMAGVDLYGGYTSSFVLENRDAELHQSQIHGLAASSVLKLEVGLALQRMDGLRVDGLGASINGIDVDQTPCQLSDIRIRACSRGIRLRSPSLTDCTEVLVANIQSSNNTLEGLSLEGPFSLTIDASRFESNGQEGLEFDPWVAVSGESVELVVTNSRFLANGAEGFDIDLVAAPVLGRGGVFKVDIEDCDFEQNVGHGCLVDVDYEMSPTWSMELSIRGSQALANAASGFALDIDSTSTCVLHRVLASANRFDGLVLTSETYAGMTLVSSSAFVGNLGYGVRTSLGNVGAALSHCLLIGNATGGIRDELAPATLASSAAHLQTAPFGMAYLRGSLVLPNSPPPFRYGAVEYRNLNALSGGTLTLDAAPNNGIGLAAELAADGILRILDSSSANNVQVTPSPTSIPLPTLFALFPQNDSVDEDYRPQGGSALLGAGMLPPIAAATDAGVFGSPNGGAPGAEDLFPAPLFRVSQQLPAWGQAIGANADLTIEFMGGIPDAASLANGVRAVDSSGNSINVNAMVQGSDLVIQAPMGGWQGGDIIELHGSLLAAGSGRPLLPIAILVGAG